MLVPRNAPSILTKAQLSAKLRAAAVDVALTSWPSEKETPHQLVWSTPAYRGKSNVNHVVVPQHTSVPRKSHTAKKTSRAAENEDVFVVSSGDEDEDEVSCTASPPPRDCFSSRIQSTRGGGVEKNVDGDEDGARKSSNSVEVFSQPTPQRKGKKTPDTKRELPPTKQRRMEDFLSRN